MSIEGEAKSLMNNEAFVAALDAARKQCINSAMACDLKDDDGRRRYLEAAKLVNSVAGHLHALILSSKTGDEVDPAEYYEERAKGRLAQFIRTLTP